MKRLALGNRADVYGAWLSAPGYDVDAATLDQMLFATSDDRPILNFLARGTLSLSASASTDVYYGITLSVLPVAFLAQRDSSTSYVWDSHVQYEAQRIVPYPDLDKVTFVNHGGVTYEGRYVIFARRQQ